MNRFALELPVEPATVEICFSHYETWGAHQTFDTKGIA